MQQSFPFTPRNNNQATPAAQVNAAVTAVQANLDITALGAPFASETTARFIVDGAQNIAWAYGNRAGLTLGNGCHMLANTVEVFMIPGGISSISHIGAASGSTLRIVVGDGQ